MADPRVTRRKTPVAPPPRRQVAEGLFKGFEEIFAAELQTDPQVQRALDMAWARQLEATWDPKKVGTVMVSRRADGSTFLINGQHRVVVALRKDPAAIMDCEVYEGLTVEEEADMFLDYNSHQKPINAYDKYRIGLRAGRTVEQMMAEQTLLRGLEISLSKGPRLIAAVAACRRIVEWDLKDHMDDPTQIDLHTSLLYETLVIAEQAFGARAETWNALPLQAIAKLIRHNRIKLDFDRLVDKLKSHLLPDWEAMAIMGSKGGGGSVSRSDAMMRDIKFEYNKRLSPQRKLR